MTNFGENTVSIFAVALNGNLTEVTGSPFATGVGPQGVLFSPNGNNIVVANRSDNSLFLFTVSTTGALHEANGSPYSTGANQPAYVAYAPNGLCLAVSDNGTRPGNVLLYSVTPNGTLTATPQSPFVVGPDPILEGQIARLLAK